MMPVQYLKRDHSLPTLVFERIDGAAPLTVVFLGGFRSDMMGTKASFLAEKCQERGVSYLRLDYRGHGQSGGVFEESCLSDWVQDSKDVIEAQTTGDIMLIGSSMGGWISLLLGLQLGERVKGIIGLAAAPDFTAWIENALTDQQKQSLADRGFFEMPNDYDVPYLITQKLLEDGRQNMILDKKMDLLCPVHLIQGKKDADVPWQTAERIKEAAVMSDNIAITYIEEADHRLSSPDQLKILQDVVLDIIAVVLP